MRIGNLRREKREGRIRVAATIIWEDCDRPTHDVYFETDERFSDSLTCNPHTFLVGCAIPAMHYGEKRVFIDENICPELLEGLEVAMRWLREWYYKPGDGVVRIEAKGLQVPPRERKPERAGFFFSGGIDSFAALRSNRLHFPPDHPRSIKDGLLVYGLEQDDPELFKHVLESLSKVADEAGITCIPVYTNLFLNYRKEDAENHFHFWEYEFGGAALAAVAHAFAGRFTNVSIASTWYSIEPWGSHPLLDPNYSSRDLKIIHAGTEFTRLDKVKLVADWDLALQNMRVCNKYKQYREGVLNCGQCEKCARTMLELVALGALNRTRAFPAQDISADSVTRNVNIKPGAQVFKNPIYEELLKPLSAIGRHDLVRALEAKLYPERASHWKKHLLEFDRRYLNNSLIKIKNLIFETKS